MMDNNARGLRVEDRAVARVRNGRAHGNAANGYVAIAIAGGTSGLSLDNCVATDNGAAGVHAGTNATVLMGNSTVSGNLDGLVISGGSMYSLGGNRVTGNINSNVPAAGLTGTIGPI
jgi:hypothetical protein